jgi:molecular chaperone IbpA
MRNTIDMTALGRTAIGFERMFDLLRTHEAEIHDTYPPYNIEKLGDDHYRIALAVAGFGESDLTVTQEANVLTVTGSKAEEADKGSYLYRGIAGRSFTRQFSLADHVLVRGAKLSNGLLTIELERELPEAMKPRHIAIGSDAAPKAFEGKRAA